MRSFTVEKSRYHYNQKSTLNKHIFKKCIQGGVGLKMMKRKWIIAAAVLFIGVFSGTAWAADSLKVVILPLQDTANYGVPEVNKLVDDRLWEHFRFPFYEKKRMDLTLGSGWRFGRAAMAELAKQQQVDLLVGSELLQASTEAEFNHWGFSEWQNDSTVMRTRVELAIYTYRLQDDRYEVWTEKLDRKEELSASSGVKSAVEELLDKLLLRLPYKRIPG